MRPRDFQEQLDVFMGNIETQESSGDNSAVSPQGARGLFQIMPSNWPSWSREVFGEQVPFTEENQRRVTAAKMTDYFDEYGSWDAVAVAWFAGPGRAKRYVEGDDEILGFEDGGDKSVRGYVEDVLDRMENHYGELPDTAVRDKGFGDRGTSDSASGSPTTNPEQRRPTFRVTDPAERSTATAQAILGQSVLPTRMGMTPPVTGPLPQIGLSPLPFAVDLQEDNVMTVGASEPSPLTSAYGPDVLLGMDRAQGLPKRTGKPPDQGFRSRKMQSLTPNGDVR